MRAKARFESTAPASEKTSRPTSWRIISVSISARLSETLRQTLPVNPSVTTTSQRPL